MAYLNENLDSIEPKITDVGEEGAFVSVTHTATQSKLYAVAIFVDVDAPPVVTTKSISWVGVPRSDAFARLEVLIATWIIKQTLKEK